MPYIRTLYKFAAFRVDVGIDPYDCNPLWGLLAQYESQPCGAIATNGGLVRPVGIATLQANGPPPSQ